MNIRKLNEYCKKQDKHIKVKKNKFQEATLNGFFDSYI